jgi:hypothetical protein
MAAIEELKNINEEQLFLDEINNKKPVFASSNEAFVFFTDKLQQIADFFQLSVKDLILKSENQIKPTELHELVLELTLKITALKLKI